MWFHVGGSKDSVLCSSQKSVREIPILLLTPRKNHIAPLLSKIPKKIIETINNTNGKGHFSAKAGNKPSVAFILPDVGVWPLKHSNQLTQTSAVGLSTHQKNISFRFRAY